MVQAASTSSRFLRTTRLHGSSTSTTPAEPAASAMSIWRVPNYDVLEKCTEDILSLIKPVEGDRNKRIYAIQELADTIYSAGALRGASVKPFGSFVSQLYAKSGDLDVSVELFNALNLPISKRKKQDTLREVRRALQKRGIARHMEFIPNARVPVLQYVSNQYGISCDISISNYPGRIKSKIFYWINTLDDRFGDMVLLVKEWAKAQNINDPKNGTLNSYSLCLLVLFHFQTCEPAILPPLKEIYEGNIMEDISDKISLWEYGLPVMDRRAYYNEKHLDEVCSINIERFRRQNMGQRNQSSLSHLLASFFHKFFRIDALSDKVISTYTGRLERIQDNPRWMDKSYSLFVEDPFEKPDNAARAVGSFEFQDIVNAFSNASNKFVSDAHALTDRNGLLSLLCTPDVGSKLGGRASASRYTNTLPARGGSRSGQSPHGYTTNRQTAVHYQNNNHPQAYNTQRQTTVHHQNQNNQQVYAAGRSVPEYPA
uniref:Poly(A) RNA polymerase mitochondrial-like central palm domain-containing protein n=1 Tax=Oryza rufipogon TaxID=4529 RepID=A0A0E0N4X0_ORYRU